MYIFLYACAVILIILFILVGAFVLIDLSYDWEQSDLGTRVYKCVLSLGSFTLAGFIIGTLKFIVLCMQHMGIASF